jgi:imidazolonepropionase-like amidohydrolase
MTGFFVAAALGGGGCAGTSAPAAASSTLAGPNAGAATAGDITIVGATVYASPEAPPIADGVVVVKNGKIAAVGKRGAVDMVGATLFDVTGATVTAGFQNSHVHFTEPKWQDAAHLPKSALASALETMLGRHGFTTVVDTGSFLPNTVAVRARIASGEIAGPRILTAGVPLYPPRGVPYYLKDSLAPDVLALLPQPSSAAEATRVAAEDIAGGADIVKLFTGSWIKRGMVLPMPVDVASAAVAEAHHAGKLVFAHPSDVAGLEVALRARVDVLAHAVEDTKGLTSALLGRMRDANMTLIPTLHLFREDTNLAAILDEVRAFLRAGGRVVFGTDVGYLPDDDTTGEYELLERAGLRAPEILATLTTAPAELFGESKIRGRLEPGMSADIAILQGDPMADVRNFARVRATLRNGAFIYKR